MIAITLLPIIQKKTQAEVIVHIIVIIVVSKRDQIMFTPALEKPTTTLVSSLARWIIAWLRLCLPASATAPSSTPRAIRSNLP